MADAHVGTPRPHDAAFAKLEVKWSETKAKARAGDISEAAYEKARDKFNAARAAHKNGSK